MPKRWLHSRQNHCGRMPPSVTELSIVRTDNPTNEHTKVTTANTATLTIHHRRRRIVSQRGRVRVRSTNVPRKTRRFFGDLFTTTLDLPFHWICLLYSAIYLISWTAFGTLWWLIYHTRKRYGYDDFYCVDNVDSWTTAFLFSIETQTTIGYGGRQVTSNCPEGVILVLIQTLVGSLIAATLLGIVFAKASRPKKRSQTVLFSEKAVVGKRNNNLCLMFRVGDLRRSQLIECHMQMELYYTKQTAEGEIPYFQERLPIGNGFAESSDTYYTMLLLPNVIAHVIDEHSPLYDMTRLDMLNASVEIVVVLEGVVECTGLTMQARTSYTANEIVWGYNFVNMPKEGCTVFKGQLMLDFGYFNQLKPVENMPLCSAKEYHRLKAQGGITANGKVVAGSGDIKNEATLTGKDEAGSSRPGSPAEQQDGGVIVLDDGSTDSCKCEVIENGLVTSSPHHYHDDPTDVEEKDVVD